MSESEATYTPKELWRLFLYLNLASFIVLVWNTGTLPQEAQYTVILQFFRATLFLLCADLIRSTLVLGRKHIVQIDERFPRSKIRNRVLVFLVIPSLFIIPTFALLFWMMSLIEGMPR